MSRPRFIHDLSWALSDLRVSSRSKSPLDDLRRLGIHMTRAALLLQPKIVANHDPDDFLDLPENDQEKLRKAVDDFRRSTSDSPEDEAPTKKQIEARLKSLKQVGDIVRKPILKEWSAAMEELIADAEGWSKKHGWITKRKTKEIDEALLGTYEAPQLLFYADGATLVLEPEARFAMGAEGVAEMAVVPSYNHLRLPRKPNGWSILSEALGPAKSNRLRRLNERAFVDAVSWLKLQK